MLKKLILNLLLTVGLSIPVISYAQAEEGLVVPTIESALAALQAAAVDAESDFESALVGAENAGVPVASILESRLLHALSTSGGLGEAMLLVSELDKHWQDIETGEGKFFSTQYDLIAMIESLKALRSNSQGDEAGFEVHAKEAYWNSPELTEMFGLGRFITEMRQAKIVEEQMKEVALPLDLEIASIDGTSTTLNALLADNEAVLLDFWASWCSPCIRLMPALKHKAEVLAPQGIYVAGMNTDSSDALSLAKSIYEKNEMNMPWLIEPADSPFSQALMIDSIPRMILIGQGGAVLFNGHPVDEALVVALAKLGVTLK